MQWLGHGISLVITIQEFSTFLGLGQEKISPVASIGLLVVTKGHSLNNQSLTIPKGSIFATSETALRFATTEENTISESASFLPVAVRCRTLGSIGNLPPNQTWTSLQINSVTATNPQAFSQGSDGQEEKAGYFPQRQRNKGPSDAQLQLSLDTAHAIIKSLLCQPEDTPFEPETDPRLKQAIFISALWFLENNVMQTLETSRPALHAVSPTERRIFKDRVYRPVLMICGHLISHRINWKRRLGYAESQSA